MRGLTYLAAALLAASVPLAAAAQSLPPADPSSILTLQGENASITTNRLSDRYYVNGLRLGYTAPTGAGPAFLSALSQAIWGPGQTRIGFDLSHQIYTPANTQATPPDRRDRPYAGLLLGNLSLINDTATSRSVLGLSLGLLGPGAGGEQLQNGFHDLIGQGHDLGWGYQIPNTPVGEVLAERTWRLPVGQIGSLQADILPELTAGIGNLRLYGQAGATFRIGQGLDSDYGVVRLRPGLSGSDAFVPTRPFAWYLFAGADGQAVGYDLLLESKPFRSGPHVPIRWGVGEFQGGLAVMAFGARLTYTQIVQTQELRHQHGGLHQLGALALSVRF